MRPILTLALLLLAVPARAGYLSNYTHNHCPLATMSYQERFAADLAMARELYEEYTRESADLVGNALMRCMRVRYGVFKNRVDAICAKGDDAATDTRAASVPYYLAKGCMLKIARRRGQP